MSGVYSHCCSLPRKWDPEALLPAIVLGSVEARRTLLESSNNMHAGTLHQNLLAMAFFGACSLFLIHVPQCQHKFYRNKDISGHGHDPAPTGSTTMIILQYT